MQIKVRGMHDVMLLILLPIHSFVHSYFSVMVFCSTDKEEVIVALVLALAIGIMVGFSIGFLCGKTCRIRQS